MQRLFRHCLTDRHLLCSMPANSRRKMFSIPDFSSLLRTSHFQEQTYHERKVFPYNRRQLYELVADVASYPQFVPFCTGSRTLDSHEEKGQLECSPTKTVMDVELKVGFLAFTESYISTVTCTPHELVEAVASSGTTLFKTLETVWRFQKASSNSPHATALPLSSSPSDDADEGPTLVNLDLKFEFASPIHAAVSRAFFGQVSQMTVKAFEERCMKVYGPGQY